MNKSELDMLEKVFSAEANLSMFQTRSKVAKKLESEGYIVEITKRFGNVVCKGYVTTILGNVTYCQSDRC